MATSLLSGVTPASAQAVTDPCTVGIRGGSVLDGAHILVLASIYGDTAAYYQPVYRGTLNKTQLWVNVEIKGDYHLKVEIYGQTSNTNAEVGYNQ